MPRGDLTCFYPVIIKSTVHIQRCGHLWSVKIWIFLTLENTTDTTHSMYSTKYPFCGWSTVSRLCCQERHWTGQRGGSRSGHWPAQSVGSCSILPTIHPQCLFPSTRKEDFNIGSRNWEMKSRHKILFTKHGKLRNLTSTVVTLLWFIVTWVNLVWVNLRDYTVSRVNHILLKWMFLLRVVVIW